MNKKHGYAITNIIIVKIFTLLNVKDICEPIPEIEAAFASMEVTS